MRLEPDEICAIAEALAPLVADILEARLDERPEWARSIPEAAAFADVPEKTIRQAIEDGRLPVVRIGRQVRIRRSDLFALRGKPHARKENGDDPSQAEADRPRRRRHA